MKEKKQKKWVFNLFFEQNAHILIPMMGTLALLCFFNPFLSFKLKIDGVKSEYFISIVELIESYSRELWVVYLVLSLTFVGIVFASLSKKMKDADVIAGFSFFMAFILMFFVREIFSNAGLENFYSASFEIAAGWIVFLLALCVGGCLVISSLKNTYTVRMMSEDGVLIATAFVLNFIKIDLIPGAGSFNLQFLPLFLIALRRNAFYSFIAGGIIYGLLTCFTDGYGFMFYPLDYLVGFGSIIFLSIFRKFILTKEEKVNIRISIFLFVGCFLVTFVRFAGSTLSSIINYDYTFQTALLYNLTYIPLSGLVPFLIILILFKYVVRYNNKMNKLQGV